MVKTKGNQRERCAAERMKRAARARYRVQRRMGYIEGADWRYYDVTDLLERWLGGDDRIDITDAMSALAMLSHNTIGDELPVFDIDGKVYTYSEAMKELKRRAK